MEIFNNLNLFGILNYPNGNLFATNDNNNFIDILNFGNKSITQENDLYIRIPFCKSRCNFCPFKTLVYSDSKAEEFIELFLTEIEKYSKSKYIKKMKFGALYIGGGTPTVLEQNKLLKIIDGLKNNFNILNSAEITLEANLASSSIVKLKELNHAGINRMTFGIQTFNNQIGKSLNLPLLPSEYIVLLKEIKKFFNNICIDLMFGLPGQDLKIWAEDIKTALSLGLQTISIYPFNLLPETVFWNQFKKRKFILNKKNVYLEMYKIAYDLLTDAGYKPYSISEFYMPGYECKYFILHTIEQSDILSLGPGASGYINQTAYYNFPNYSKYKQALIDNLFPIEKYKKANEEELKRRFMVIGLRNLEINLDLYKSKFDSDLLEDFHEEIQMLINNKYLFKNQNFLKINENVYFWANNIRKKLGEVKC